MGQTAAQFWYAAAITYAEMGALIESSGPWMQRESHRISELEEK